MDIQRWHRNAGRRSKYHLDRLDWARSGKAECGVNISYPGFVARNLVEIERAGGTSCKTCIKARARRWPADATTKASAPAKG